MQPRNASKHFSKKPTFFKGVDCMHSVFVFVCGPKVSPIFSNNRLEITGISSLNIFNHATTTTLKKKWGAAATCFFDNSFRSAAGGRAGTSLAFGFFGGTLKEMMLDFVFFFVFFFEARAAQERAHLLCL